MPTRRKSPPPPVQQLLDEDIEERFVKVSSAPFLNAPHAIPSRMSHPKRNVEKAGRLASVPSSGMSRHALPLLAAVCGFDVVPS